MHVQQHVALGPLTTFRVGGTASYFAEILSAEDLQEAYAFAQARDLSVWILGGGSNVLVSDEGLDGLVLAVKCKGMEMCADATLVAAAGESWDSVVLYAVERNMWGIENLSGIPGSVGGAVVQNIGAYGTALSDTCCWVELFDTQERTVRTMGRDECAFGYRESIFTQTAGNFVVLRAAFSLSREGRPNLSYGNLAESFPHGLASPLEVRQAVLSVRKQKFPDLTEEGTAGSFFKNPVLLPEEAAKLQTRYPDMPLFDLPEAPGRKKVPLAYLLDTGLALKGFSHGSARLYEKQPLVIAALPPATARDIEALARDVEKMVMSKYGITIEREVRTLR